MRLKKKTKQKKRHQIWKEKKIKGWNWKEKQIQKLS
jgi:hypothetical protein